MMTVSLSFDDATIPADLKALQQWVNWKAVPNGERMDKIPVCPSTGSNASTTNPETWTDYNTAAMQAMTNDGLGLGFVFVKTAGIIGIDLDHCRDADGGTLEPWAEAIVRALESYTEVSPSGTGVHIYVRGGLPPGRRKKGSVEVYEAGRFFTMTGNHIEDTPTSIEDRPDQLSDFHAQHLADPMPTARHDSTPRTQAPVCWSDQEIIGKCRAARNAAKFGSEEHTSELQSPI